MEEAEKKWKLQNKSLKVKDKEMHDLKKQNEYTEEILMKVKAEYKDCKVKINKEKEFLNSLIPSLKADSLECNNCDVKVESVKALKMHKRAVHMKSNLTQTEESILEDKCVQFSEDKIVHVTVSAVVMRGVENMFKVVFVTSMKFSGNKLRSDSEQNFYILDIWIPH